ncbi:MAG TPA: hypothetical protein VFY18_01650, partial [Candidatus Limnocylindrales bacterium]|nr:hypothetical protein [Candidatus Limnocylindrales bacterium]
HPSTRSMVRSTMVEMRSLARHLAPLAVLLAVALVAWLPLIQWGTPTVLDGYPLGTRAACADSCPRFTAAAVAWLDSAVPGHAPVDQIELFVPDYRDSAGNRILMNRSGGTDYVAVIHLADRSVRAIQVGCGVGVDPDRCFTSAPMTMP